MIDHESAHIQEGFRRVVSLNLERTTPEGARFTTDEGTLQVGFFAPGVIRLTILTQPLPDYDILVASQQPITSKTIPGENSYTIEADGIALELQTTPLRLSLRRNDLSVDCPGALLLESATDRSIQGELRLSPFARNDQEWLVSLALQSEEAIFGLGEKFGSLNRRGQLVRNWNRDAGGVNAEISYKNTPFAWSSAGWGLFVHTPAPVTHGIGYAPWSHRSYILKIHEPNLDLFLIVANSPAEMLEKYTFLTGRASLPPLWSYGMWMSRAYYKTADEILEVARQLRQRRIPCDVLTLDGRAWHKPETRFDFSWDPDRYPDPPEFVRQLREMNYRLCLWEYPYLSTRNPLFAELDAQKMFLSDPQGETYINRWLPPPLDTFIPHLQPSGIFDFTNPKAYAWYRDAHKSLFEMGVAAMKPDYGEAVPEEVVAHNGDTGTRLHNVYALLYNRCVFEAAQMYGQGEALVWSRAGWSSSQRYPIQWGGDPQGDWEGLAGSIRGGLSWGMSGAPFYTHDIGGFYGRQEDSSVLGAGRPDPELYVRWAQAGIMASHTRFHGTSPREPWEFGQEIEAIIRHWVEWRYRLIPYLQACAQEASQTGMPVARAMPMAFPEDPCAWSFETQYMLGPALLVAPVIQSGGRVRFYLPAGTWYDLWDNERLEGPCLLNQNVSLDRIPIYGRQGHLLPLGPIVQHTGELQPGQIEEIWAFGQPESGQQLYSLPVATAFDPVRLTRHRL